MGADAFGLAFAEAMAEMNPVARAERDEQRWIDAFLKGFREEAEGRFDTAHEKDHERGRLVFRVRVGRYGASLQIDDHARRDFDADAIGRRWAQQLTAELDAKPQEET